MATTLKTTPVRAVPCDGCTACCEGDMILMHPECGDDHRRYKCEQLPDGSWMLRHKKNGDCIYLERGKGCTIWHRRPVVCRELDCRLFLTLPNPDAWVAAGGMNPKVLKAARRLVKLPLDADPE